MKCRKGFTLIELMIVILIVGILAAVLVPVLSSRINAAKWSEGKAGAGTVATALRAWLVEQDVDYSGSPSLTTDLDFTTADLQGKYFALANYSIAVTSYTAATNAMDYLITVNAPAGLTGTLTLDELGVMTGP